MLTVVECLSSGELESGLGEVAHSIAQPRRTSGILAAQYGTGPKRPNFPGPQLAWKWGNQAKDLSFVSTREAVRACRTGDAVFFFFFTKSLVWSCSVIVTPQYLAFCNEIDEPN